jgi:hypothetical protein
MDYLDSLLAVEISSWIERELGVKVTIMELMKGPTIAQLAATLLTRAGMAGEPAGVPAQYDPARHGADGRAESRSS